MAPAPLVWEFIVAGADCRWALAHVVTQPEVQNKLYREVVGVERGFVPDESLRSTPYLRAVVLECLRMHPTVPLVVGNNGTTRFAVMASDIGRNGKAWMDPDVFRPERFLGPRRIGDQDDAFRCRKEALSRGRYGHSSHCFAWTPSAESGGAVHFEELDVFFKVMKTPLKVRIASRR
ncbi:hypothetical protein HU200_001303 [Digitaria exilis]|uniref:Cytochrome P450 n=1 Tax=Digitaria exilis TaxID=1010633 RepID=A0A835FYS1_9POAL|nr:hypothetical protein HU200_001303 [Digitaria exilis]